MTVSFEIVNTGNCHDDRITVKAGGKKTVLLRTDVLRLGLIGPGPVTIEIDGEHKGEWAGEIESIAIAKRRRLTEQHLR